MSFVETIAGLIMLLFGAEFLVRGAVALARRLKVSPMVIGLTIVAYGTTAPELVVSLKAALIGAPGIAVGNVVGSNIANILLILGTSAVIFPIVCKPRGLIRDGAVVGIVAVFFALLGLGGVITPWHGIPMLAALVAFSVYAFITERRGGAAAELHERESAEFDDVPQALWLTLLSILGGLASIIYGAQLLLTGAIDLARMFGVSEAVIGLTLVAIGTSLPELATAVVAAYRRHSDVALGNVLGANIYNILGIMGVVSVITPITIPAQMIAFDLWVLVAVTGVLLTAIFAARGISRPLGIGFLMLYACYIGIEYYGVGAVVPGLG